MFHTITWLQCKLQRFLSSCLFWKMLPWGKSQRHIWEGVQEKESTQSCHSSPGWSMSRREALVTQTAWNRSHAWQLYQQETDHHPRLKSFYDSYLSTSRTSEVYNLAWILPCNQMPVLKYMNFTVSLSKVGLPQKFYWMYIKKEGFY